MFRGVSVVWAVLTVAVTSSAVWSTVLLDAALRDEAVARELSRTWIATPPPSALYARKGPNGWEYSADGRTVLNGVRIRNIGGLILIWKTPDGFELLDASDSRSWSAWSWPERPGPFQRTNQEWELYLDSELETTVAEMERALRLPEAHLARALARRGELESMRSIQRLRGHPFDPTPLYEETYLRESTVEWDRQMAELTTEIEKRRIAFDAAQERFRSIVRTYLDAAR